MEQGLTGRKRPYAPRSKQLQTSITVIIYPVLSKCTRLRVPAATRKQALHRQIYGHSQLGPGGKASFPLVISVQKGGKKEKKEKSVFCTTERAIYYRAFAGDSICCPAAFSASVGCLNEKWEYINQLMGYRRRPGMGPSNFAVLRQVKGQESVSS